MHGATQRNPRDICSLHILFILYHQERQVPTFFRLRIVIIGHRKGATSCFHVCIYLPMHMDMLKNVDSGHTTHNMSLSFCISIIGIRIQLLVVSPFRRW